MDLSGGRGNCETIGEATRQRFRSGSACDQEAAVEYVQRREARTGEGDASTEVRSAIARRSGRTHCTPHGIWECCRDPAESLAAFQPRDCSAGRRRDADRRSSAVTANSRAAASVNETYTAVIELDDNSNARTVVLRDRDGAHVAVIDGPLSEEALARNGYRILSGPCWRANVERIDAS